VTVDLAPGELPPLAPELTSFGSDPRLLHDELRGFIADAVINDPRSLQREIGISEVGTPCTRRLAYKLGDVPPSHPEGVAWRTVIGRAAHTWLAEVFAEVNRKLGFTRFLIESRVSPGMINGKPLNGNGDLYDRVTGAVVDWKIPGPYGMRKIRPRCVPGGPGPEIGYRVQAHGYGLGYVRRGLPVESVSIAFLPAAGEFRDAVWWTEPFDPRIAEAALDRASKVDAMGAQIGHALVGSLSGTAEDYCDHCPWFAPTRPDPADGRCPGAAEVIAERSKARQQKPPDSPFG